MKRAILATLAVTSAAIALMALQPVDRPAGVASDAGVETVVVQPARFSYREPGEFLRDGRPVDGPMVDKYPRRPIEIMAFQVSAADYTRCVGEGVCGAPEGKPAAGTHPVTGVSYTDAMRYAQWLSARTGETWRLPSDEEWAFVAAERFGDDALGLDDDGSNPATRWLAAYRSRSAPADDAGVKEAGSFGVNSKGLHDVSGSVWEWTSTCYTRSRVEASGRVTKGTENCGVRVLGGKHRSYMSFFLQNGKSGGCAAGMAPDNLGFRLVRERKPAGFLALFQRMLPDRA